MPAGVRHNPDACPDSKPWEIYNKATGKHYGCSATKEKALASARAIDESDRPKGR